MCSSDLEFNEVYLTDVRIPDANRLGDEGDGWRVSLTTLMNERTSIGAGTSGGGPRRGSGPISEAVKLWQALPADQRSAAKRERLMQLWVKAENLRLTNMRAAVGRRQGNPGPEGSVAKLAMAELNKSVYEFCLDLMGPAAMVGYDFTFRRPTELNVEGWGEPRQGFLRVRANSIEGGTSEIMRNILGEQVLGLPGEPQIGRAHV